MCPFSACNFVVGKCVLAPRSVSHFLTHAHFYILQRSTDLFAVVIEVSLGQLKIVSVRLMPRTWCELYCHLCRALASWALSVVPACLPAFLPLSYTALHTLYSIQLAPPVHHRQHCQLLLPLLKVTFSGRNIGRSSSWSSLCICSALVIFHFTRSGLFTEFKLQPDNMERAFGKQFGGLRKLCTNELGPCLAYLYLAFSWHNTSLAVVLTESVPGICAGVFVCVCVSVSVLAPNLSECRVKTMTLAGAIHGRALLIGLLE